MQLFKWDWLKIKSAVFSSGIMGPWFRGYNSYQAVTFCKTDFTKNHLDKIKLNKIYVVPSYSGKQWNSLKS